MIIENYIIDCLAMAIVNNTNEVNGVSAETRQKNNDQCFDFAVKKINTFLCDKFDVITFKDNVGGLHEEGLGWSPDGNFCGECSRSSCEQCPVWRTK